MIEILKIISLIFGIFFGGYTIVKIFSPFFKRKKLKRFFGLVQDWFDEIDKNLETGINLSILNNKESKITSFVEENHLNKHKIKISKRFIRRYLKKVGIKKESQNDMSMRESYSVLDFLTLLAAHEGLAMTIFAILLQLLRQTTRQAIVAIPEDRIR